MTDPGTWVLAALALFTLGALLLVAAGALALTTAIRNHRGRPPAAPLPLVTAQDTAVHQLLADACCERWWTSAGAEHETDHCARKDQTT